MAISFNKQKVYLASDHAGLALKEEIKNWLEAEGVTICDHGAFVHDKDDDFPDFISLAAASVSLDFVNSCAIIFGGSGQGEAMLANRFTNVRATTYYHHNPEIIVLSREHNDANVLAIGARFVTVSEAKDAISLWLQTEHNSDPKYSRRNQKIEQITKQIRTV